MVCVGVVGVPGEVGVVGEVDPPPRPGSDGRPGSKLPEVCDGDGVGVGVLQFISSGMHRPVGASGERAAPTVAAPTTRHPTTAAAAMARRWRIMMGSPP
ncbi:hypothetical protein CJ026_026145 [Ralstonia pickettii]|nr:hypothetical protein CJ026_026145 [Ralstonia pickettii]